MVGPGASDRGRDMAAVACRRVSSVIRLHQPSPRMNRRRSSRVASPAAISASPVANEMAAPVEGVVCEPLLPEELLADDLLPEDVASEEELVDDDSDDSLSVDVASEEVALRCDVVAAVEVLVSGEDFVDDDSVVVPVHAVPGAGTRA